MLSKSFFMEKFLKLLHSARKFQHIHINASLIGRGRGRGVSDRTQRASYGFFGMSLSILLLQTFISKLKVSGAANEFSKFP